jgi:Gly-Xaa carboxypeptidase
MTTLSPQNTRPPSLFTQLNTTKMAKNWGAQVPVRSERPHKRMTNSSFIGIALSVGAICFLFRHYIIGPSAPQWTPEVTSPGKSEPRCPQVEPLFPSKGSKELDDMQAYFESDD